MHQYVWSHQDDRFEPDDKISGGCLTAGHKVKLINGEVKDISEMELNDKVETLFGEDLVVNIWHYQKPTINLELDTGETIECSYEHKFLVVSENGLIWVEAKDLNEFDEIISV